MGKRFLLLAFFFCGLSGFTLQVYAQNVPNEILSFDCKSCEVIELLKSIEEKHPYRFFYKNEWVRKKKIYLDSNTITLQELLLKLQKEQDLKYIYRNPNYIVFLKPGTEVKPIRSFTEVVIGQAGTNSDFDEVELKGKIKHSETKEPLIGSSIYVSELKRGVTTDANGNYSLRLVPGSYHISFSGVNVTKLEFDFTIYGSGEFNIELSEDVTILKEAVVTDKSDRDILNTTQMGATTLTAKEIAKIPAYMGEVDIVRSVMSLPGVSSVGEGSSGFNIRGGLAGQNLILMDGMPIYNPAHLAGFFSTFNPDIVDKVTLYRGGVPANFGGRSSAFLDVKLKEGDVQKITGDGGAGILASRFSIQVPVARNKSSLLAGIRVAYPNYIIGALRNERIKKSKAFFYDFNVKYNQTFQDGSKFLVSAYSSYDDVNFARETQYSFGNNSFNIEWRKLVGEKFMVKLSLIDSHYEYSVSEGELDRGYTLNSYVNDARFNAEVSYRAIQNHALTAGWQTNKYTVNSGKYTPNSSSLDKYALPKDHGIETAFFLQDEYTISPNLTLDAGLRYSIFFKVGPGTETFYTSGVPRSEEEITATKPYSSGKIIKSYSGLEPRLSLLYKLNETNSVKVGAHRIYQYIHLISNSTAITPIDLWKISNRNIKPTFSDQVSAGYFVTLKENKYEVSAELYYKITHNTIDYRDGTTLYLNEHVETYLLQGKGRSYGSEVLIRKKEGKLTGWLAYTYSRSLQSFDSRFAINKINDGKYYAANFDRPHDLKLYGDWMITNRFSVSGNFTYSTGRPITYPESIYEVDGVTVANYSDRNQYRIPDTHRLDLSFTMTTTLKKVKAVEANWTFSIYNVYGRENPYSVFFKNEGGQVKGYKLSVFADPFFSLTYNFKF